MKGKTERCCTLPFLNLMRYASYQLAEIVFSFLGIYFIGGKVEKLINAPVEHFTAIVSYSA